MIVSFSRNFAFVAVPRTGTHAVRAALRPHLASTDWEQCTRYERRLCPVPAIAAMGHGHLTAAQIRGALIPGLWERMTTFAFLRDPLARFRSAYLLLNRDRAEDAGAAIEGMKRVLGDREAREHVLYRPQAEFVCDVDGRPMVGMLGYTEAIDRDLGTIFSKLNLPEPVIERLNSAQYPVGHLCDAELGEIVAERFVADYALLEGLAELAP